MTKKNKKQIPKHQKAQEEKNKNKTTLESRKTEGNCRQQTKRTRQVKLVSKSNSRETGAEGETKLEIQEVKTTKKNQKAQIKSQKLNIQIKTQRQTLTETKVKETKYRYKHGEDTKKRSTYSSKLCW